MNIIFQLLQKYFMEDKWLLIGIAVFSILINLIQTNVISSITASIIDSVEHGAGKNTMQYFYYFFGISILYLIIQYVNENLHNEMGSKLIQWLRKEMVTHIFKSSNENFKNTNLFKYHSPINRASYSAYHLINTMLTNGLMSLSFVLIVTGYFLYKNTALGMLFLISNLIIFVSISSYWNIVMEKKAKYEMTMHKSEEHALDLFSNLDKVIYRGEVENELENYKNIADNGIQLAKKFYGTATNYTTITICIMYILILTCLYYLITLVKNKSIDTKIFIAFFTMLLLYREQMTWVIRSIPSYIDFHGRMDYAAKVFDDIDFNINSNTDKKYEEVNLPFETIEFKNVYYKYNTGNEYILKDFSLLLNTNQNTIGITGLSGKGKSTLAKLALRLYTCEKGEVLIDGKNVTQLDPTYIRKNIVYVNQSSKLFNKKMSDNLTYGCSAPEICDKYLRIIMKYPKIKELYKNIDLKNGLPGSLGENISGGQRQIINIISGLVSPSKILILDEPTNALDMGLKQELLKIIEEFKKYKQCIIIITHDRDVYPLFDERLKM